MTQGGDKLMHGNQNLQLLCTSEEKLICCCGFSTLTLEPTFGEETLVVFHKRPLAIGQSSPFQQLAKANDDILIYTRELRYKWIKAFLKCL